ncbi:DUF1904 family protein [Cohnella nanjingensis]|uniref:DUF1904 family protein n=1 Tax=Cohnella nanjingensis TaxID=1387779 RepID=A0A7X0RXB3_9BACL|nr:DUF1904 family protein [Cohnella nanjingensis]MBB6675343.1 DUF1904 family protein [Cohnella nanjingensis]
MPHLLFRGVLPEQVRAISGPLADELAAICGCPADDMMLECQHTTSLARGEIVPSYPFVEVAWFERGPETRARFAQTVDRHVRGLGIPELEVAFRTYRPAAYYANGEAFGEDPAETELAALRAENGKLKEDLQRARRAAATAANGAASAMSSRLRDALRE